MSKIAQKSTKNSLNSKLLKNALTRPYSSPGHLNCRSHPPSTDDRTVWPSWKLTASKAIMVVGYRHRDAAPVFDRQHCSAAPFRRRRGSLPRGCHTYRRRRCKVAQPRWLRRAPFKNLFFFSIIENLGKIMFFLTFWRILEKPPNTQFYRNWEN